MTRKRRMPDTNSYRAAVRAIMEAVQRQYELNDTELADRIGCSAGTVRNAKHEHSNLDGVTLAGIENRFGPGAVDPFLALGGSRATPLPTALPEIDPVLDIVEALHRLIQAQHASSEHGFLITSRELLSILQELRDARRAFDVLLLLAEPGLASASPELRRWFHDAFEKPHDRPQIDATSTAEEALPTRVEVPAGFVDAAGTSDVAELGRRYDVPADTIERWLKESDKQLSEALVRQQRHE